MRRVRRKQLITRIPSDRELRHRQAELGAESLQLSAWDPGTTQTPPAPSTVIATASGWHRPVGDGCGSGCGPTGGSVPLHVGAGYDGDPDWTHGRWMGPGKHDPTGFADWSSVAPTPA
jgi:hypothetical protein